MILTDREIKISIEKGVIGVEPRPKADAYASTSLDLTLDSTIKTFPLLETGLEQTIDPAFPGYSFVRVIDKIARDDHIGAEGFVVSPQQFLLAWTKERISLDPMSRTAARVEGKSSLARLGLGVHVTAPTIHAGFTGRIQLEIANHGPMPIRLREGMYICQLIFEQTLGVPDKGYVGQFAGQRSLP